MNEAHAACGGPEWRTLMRSIVPKAIGDRDLGDDVVEVGPGYGAATDVLCESAAQLTLVEIDPELVALLSERFADRPNVRVLRGDATALDLPDGRFTGAACFTMLHHVPTADGQDAIFGELRRVLRADAWLVAGDNLASADLRGSHVDDTYNPVDPATLPARLTAAGFAEIQVRTNAYAWSVTARAV